MVAGVIVDLGSGHGLESGLSCSSVMGRLDLGWHVARRYHDTYMLIRDDQ